MRIASVIASFAAVASAAPAVYHIAATEDYSWDVTGWVTTYTNNTYTYDFKVAGAASDVRPAKPGFSAHCSGKGVGVAFAQCQVANQNKTGPWVSAKLNAVNTTGAAQVAVSYRYVDEQTSSTWWNYSGTADTKYNPHPLRPLSFTVTPDTIEAAG